MKQGSSWRYRPPEDPTEVPLEGSPGWGELFDMPKEIRSFRLGESLLLLWQLSFREKLSFKF